MFGIDNLKKLVKFSLDLANQIAVSGKDGWQWTDSFSFIDEIAEIPGVVKSLVAVKQEISDLSPEERQELNDYIAAHFNIPNDKLELFIEHAISQAMSLWALVEEFKNLH